LIGDIANAGTVVVAGNFHDLKSNQWTIDLTQTYTPERKPSDDTFSDVLEAADAEGGGPGEALKGIGETFGPAGIAGAAEHGVELDGDTDCQDMKGSANTECKRDKEDEANLEKAIKKCKNKH